jgi:hypothetical protein
MGYRGQERRLAGRQPSPLHTARDNLSKALTFSRNISWSQEGLVVPRLFVLSFVNTHVCFQASHLTAYWIILNPGNSLFTVVKSICNCLLAKLREDLSMGKSRQRTDVLLSEFEVEAVEAKEVVPMRLYI